MVDPSKIYDRLHRHYAPYTLPGPWARFPTHVDFVQVQDPGRLLKVLQESFSDDELIESGVATHSNGQTNLTAHLANADSLVLALRNAADSPPFDLWANGASVGNLYWPILAILSDYRTHQLFKGSEAQLFVPFSMTDLAVLLSIGLPTALPAGLDTFSQGRIDVLCSAFGIRRRAPGHASEVGNTPKEPTGEMQSYRPLIFLAWSPATFELAKAPMLRDIQEHIREIENGLGIHFDNCEIWNAPTSKEIDHIMYCIRNGDTGDVRKALLDSLEINREQLVQIGPNEIEPNGVEPIRPAENYIDALRILLDNGAQGSGGDRQKDAWRQVEQLRQAELVDPLLRQAAASKDPVDANLLDLFAQVCRGAHAQMLLMVTKFCNSISERGIAASQALPGDELQQALALIDRARGMALEIQPWRNRGKTAISSLRKPKAK